MNKHHQFKQLSDYFTWDRIKSSAFEYLYWHKALISPLSKAALHSTTHIIEIDFNVLDLSLCSYWTKAVMGRTAGLASIYSPF